MNPIPHSIDGCLVLALDFVRGWVLLGELTRAGDPTSGVRRHVRLRLVDDVWHRDRGGSRLSHMTCPPLDAEDYHWLPDRQPLADAPRIYPVPAPIIVERSDLQRALDRVSKLTGRALDETGLLTVAVHPHGLSLASHGLASIVADVPKVGDSPARDGLAHVVVLAEALRAVVKESRDKIEIAAEPRCEGRALAVEGRRVWTVNAAPAEVHACVAPARDFDRALSDAVARALVFACTDEARVNLNRIALHGRGDQVIVEATDGHRLYRERVDGVPIFGEGFYTVPQRVLASLRSGKRAGAYRFAVAGDDVSVTCDGLTVVCGPSPATWPPCEQLLAPVLREQRSTYGWETRTLAGETVNALRRWVNERDGDERICMQFTDEPFAVRVQTGSDASACFGGETFTPLVTTRGEATPWNTPRGVLAHYLADALAAFPKDSDVQFTVTTDEESREPIYLTDVARTLVVMPCRP